MTPEQNKVDIGQNYYEELDLFEALLERHQSQFNLPSASNSNQNDQSIEGPQESSTGPSTQTQLKDAPASPKKNKDKQRWDQRCKNLPQNIGSTAKTNIPKIMSETESKSRRKTDMRERRSRLQEFLKLHKADNNQFIIPFCYLFAKMERAQPSQFISIGKAITRYLDKRIAQSADFEKEEREIYVERVNIHKRMVSQYFDGNCMEIDLHWLKNIGSKLFTGRQANTIGKPLRELEKIQNTLAGQKLEVSFHDQHIQEFFESDSGNY